MRDAPTPLHQIALPHSLDFRVSLRIDHEAPVDVLLNGVEPPELPGHDDEDGRDIDQHQALVWELWDEVTHDDSVQYVQSVTHQYKHQAYTCPLRQPVIHDPRLDLGSEYVAKLVFDASIEVWLRLRLGHTDSELGPGPRL